MFVYLLSSKVVTLITDSNPTEYAAFEDTFSPVLHRIDQAVRWRAVHPSEPIPPVDEILTRYSKPPEGLIQQARPQLEKLIATADIKKGILPSFFMDINFPWRSVCPDDAKYTTVPPKQKGRKRDRDKAQPLSGLDVDELLGRERGANKKISAENAIPEFKQLLATARDPHAIEDAVKQLAEIITQRIKHSLGDNGYGQALEALGVMREELIAYEEPRLYNDFITRLKEQILSGELNGDREDMQRLIRGHRLGLITSRESDVSEVTEEEAKEVSLRVWNSADFRSFLRAFDWLN